MGTASGRLERSTVIALVAMALAVFVVANDVTALSVALPKTAKTPPERGFCKAAG
jgi:hypothetical protein